MKIKEFIELLSKYPQHQDVMISCGNCNHGHTWYEGQPMIVDHTNQTYGYIDIQILNSQKLGSTFRLVSDGKRVLEQDVIIPSQGRPKEEAKKPMEVRLDPKAIDSYYSMGIVNDDLETYFLDQNVYEITALDKWKSSFKKAYKAYIGKYDLGEILVLKCPVGYSDLMDMMLEHHKNLIEVEG